MLCCFIVQTWVIVTHSHKKRGTKDKNHTLSLFYCGLCSCVLTGGDQGLLNSFFSSWSVEDIGKHLPFVYNLSASSVYSYLPAFQQ